MGPTCSRVSRVVRPSLWAMAVGPLGAEALAQVLIAHADTDPVLRKTTRNRYAGATSSGLSAPSICGPISSACQISRISKPSKGRSRWLPATSRPNEPWRS